MIIKLIYIECIKHTLLFHYESNAFIRTILMKMILKYENNESRIVDVYNHYKNMKSYGTLKLDLFCNDAQQDLSNC